MVEGLYLSDCLNGLRKIPDESIDLIITEPSINFFNNNQQSTLKDYYKWNQEWLFESKRILKNSVSIYLMTNWKFSSMYHSLLSNIFKIRSRIIWRNRSSNLENEKEWINDTSDIWFASKTEEYVFREGKGDNVNIENNFQTHNQSNLWIDIPKTSNNYGKYSQKIYSRILKSSSFSLNWILDPFMALGDVGVASKNLGRRFIGFEEDKDYLLLAMKRIDRS